MALCATTAFAGAVLQLCVRGARGRSGGTGPVASQFPRPSRAGCCMQFQPLLPFPTCWYALHAVCAFCGLGPVPLQVRTACSLCVCALALMRRASSPPCRCEACILCSTHAGGRWGHLRRFVPLCVSCPAPVLRLCSVRGGVARSPRLPAWLLVPVGRISLGPPRWPPGAEERLVPETTNLKPQTYLWDGKISAWNCSQWT